MKKLMLAVAIVLFPFCTIAADDELAGTYKLVSSTRKILDSGEVLDTWGKNPNGVIIYGKDGRMLVLIVRRDRPKPESRQDHRPTASGPAPLNDGVRRDVQVRWQAG
jgi:Lipocalin-like domain